MSHSIKIRTADIILSGLAALLVFFTGTAAVAQSSNDGYLVGFREAVIKTAVRSGGSQFQRALSVVIPSSRRREVSSKTIGRLKRNITNSIARGKQSSLSFIDAKVVQTSRAPNNARLRGALGMGVVRYVVPNIRLSASAFPNDPNLGPLWGLHNTKGGFLSTVDVDINAPEAWEITTGSDSTVIAVLDTGIDPLHPDLAQNMWVNDGEIPGNGRDDDGNGYIDDVNGCNFIDYDPGKSSACGAKVYNAHHHGTHVAGTIGARGDNGIGISGVAQKVKLVSLAFLNKDGSGSLADMLEGIEYAITLKKRAAAGRKGGANIRAINCSFGHTEGFTQPEYDAFKAMEDAGILMVVAAGNGGPDGLADNNDKSATYPSNYDLDGIISVAAIGRGGSLTYFSNYGAESVDLAAPGSNIGSTVLNGGYAIESGTSMAAPHVAGVAALLFAHQPRLTPWVVKQILMASVKDAATIPGLSSLNGKLVSPGIVDAESALKLSQTDLSTPRVIKSPKSQSVPKGSSLTLSVQAFSTAPLTYRWYKNGAIVSGASKATLTIKSADDGDAGNYYCVVSAGSNSAQSAAAVIKISAKTKADINGDGLVNFGDVMVLFLDLGKKGAGQRSDLNGDGVVDMTDLDLLLKAIKP